MVVNVGNADRIIRFLIGIVLIVLPFAASSSLPQSMLFQLGLPIVGAVLVVTAMFRFCPLYRVFGLRTCRT